MKILRSIAGVITGIIVMFVLVFVTEIIGAILVGAMPDPATGRFPEGANVTGLCIWNVAWNVPICLVAGGLTGVIAGRRAMLHASMLAGVILAGGVLYAIFGRAVYEEAGAPIPGWYLPSLPVAGIIGALLGGRIVAAWQARRSGS